MKDILEEALGDDGTEQDVIDAIEDHVKVATYEECLNVFCELYYEENVQQKNRYIGNKEMLVRKALINRIIQTQEGEP